MKARDPKKLYALLAWGIAIALMTTQLIPTAHADSSTHKTCSELSSNAEQVMRNRQQGVAMREQIGLLPDNPLWRKIVESAYDEPLYNTDEYIERTVTEFGNDIYQLCQENLK